MEAASGISRVLPCAWPRGDGTQINLCWVGSRDGHVKRSGLLFTNISWYFLCPRTYQHQDAATGRTDGIFSPEAHVLLGEPQAI